ncbi:MAG: sulfatase-like hydrolase/transferase [Saprospiraceae bacterium]
MSEKNASSNASTLPFELPKPNVLMIMADELRFPIHKDAGGMIKDLKNIIGFQNVDENIKMPVEISEKAKRLFPGFMRLRENAVSLRNHTVATTACVPSRAALFTGQYGTKNTVTQTDGVFKDGSDPRFGWLDENGLPTLGDWFKASDYTTHYFGKCHFAHPDKPTLAGLGFENWESSYPEPHGTLRNNLGMYRDPGFTDLVTTFLRRKGMALDYDQEVGMIEQDMSLTPKAKEEAILEIKKKPWFAVASFTNPHDITTWPVLPAQSVGETDPSKPSADLIYSDPNLEREPLGIPAKGTRSAPPMEGTWTFDMNPGGIDKSYARIPSTLNEDLGEKPDCQYDYSVKLGIALAAKTGDQFKANNSGKLTGLPLALAPKPGVWSAAYIEYYTYLHHVLDQQIDRVLKTLDDTGMRDNTIVLFVPDHGEYGGSHGMMQQKWHTAYQEAIHVPVIISMPNQNDTINNIPKQIRALTSHIDLAPTLLGLIGVRENELPKLKARIYQETKKKALDFVGADLSRLIMGEETVIPDQFATDDSSRDAILFTTSDMITEPFGLDGEHQGLNNDFEIFKKAVDRNITKHDLGDMKGGPVAQPSEVHCVRQRNNDGDWKLVRYRDYYDPENSSLFQWEMYNLMTDPTESLNLLSYKANDPFVANESAIDHKLNAFEADQIVDQAQKLDQRLQQLIENMT